MTGIGDATGIGGETAVEAAARYTARDVAVDGGSMRVGIWEPVPTAPGPAATVLAVHGITANHRCWPLLAQALPDIRIVAPDLRGRGRSNALPGPFGLPAHADDLARVLESVEAGPAVVVGHSMGAFVALVTADRYPALVSALLLVDGGLPLEAPPGVGADEAIQAVLGPAAQRLGMTFPSRAAYREFWQQHPAFADDWSPVVADYVDYDLCGEEPQLRPSTSFDAVAADSRDITLGAALPRALERLRHPARLLLAERGVLDQRPPLYPDDALALWREQLPQLRMVRVDDVNHYTITMHERGITHVAEAVRALLSS